MRTRNVRRAVLGLALGASVMQFGGCGGNFFNRSYRAFGVGFLDGVTAEGTGFATSLIPLYELTEILLNGPITEAAETAVGEDAANGAEALEDNTGTAIGT